MNPFNKGTKLIVDDVVYFTHSEDVVKTINELPERGLRYETVLLWYTPAGMCSFVIHDKVEGHFWNPNGTKPTEARGSIGPVIDGRTKAKVGGIR